MTVWDTAGVKEYARLRPLTYADADVVVLCFAVDRRSEFEEVARQWKDELGALAKDVPVVLVGEPFFTFFFDFFSNQVILRKSVGVDESIFFRQRPKLI